MLFISITIVSHCVKSVGIRNYSGSYFPAFGLNTERYGVFSPYSISPYSVQMWENTGQNNCEYGHLPNKCKTSLVITLLEGCFQTANSYENVHKEIEKLKNIMLKNTYPKPILDKVIKHFLDKKSNVEPVCDTSNKCKARIAVSYLRKSSKVLRAQSKELFKEIPCCSIQTIELAI